MSQRHWNTERQEWVYPLTDLEKELLEALKATTTQLERVLNLMGLEHDDVAETILYRGKDAIEHAEAGR